MKKHIYQFITCLLVMQARFLFFSWKIKMSNLFTCRINFDYWQSVHHSLVYFACVGLREYPGNFQNETVISKLFFKRSAQMKWERGKTFLKWTRSINLSSKLSLTYRGNVNYYKSVHHPIPTLPVGTESTLAIFKINQ